MSTTHLADALARSCRPGGFWGQLPGPAEPDYEARRVFNAMIDRWPALIARCSDSSTARGAAAMILRQAGPPAAGRISPRRVSTAARPGPGRTAVRPPAGQCCRPVTPPTWCATGIAAALSMPGQRPGQPRVLGDHPVQLAVPEEGEVEPDPESMQRRLPAPTSRMVASTPRTLPSSWAYLPDFSAMSSPNHFACSCASA